MRRIALALFFACAAAPLLAQRPAPAAGTPQLTLRGVLVDAGKGGALPRARVDVMAGSAHVGSVMADSEGRFSVEVPSGRAPTIRVVKSGYASIALPVSPRQIAGVEPLRIEVPAGAVITGRATDESGEPALRVAVRRLPSSGDTVWSPAQPDGLVLADNLSTLLPDDRGEYRIGGLVAGRYVVEAYPALTRITVGPSGLNVKGSESPFQASSVIVDLQAGSQATVDLVLERRPSESLPADPPSDPAGSTIRGTVSSTNGTPLAGATVTAGGPSGGRNARTDASGRFILRGIGSGPVTVRATKRGYVSSQPGQRGGTLPGQPLIIEPGRDLDDLSIVMPRGGAISGMVIDEHGEPVQEAAVQLVRARREATGALVGLREQSGFVERTDDRGQFRLSGVVPGNYVVMALLPVETVNALAATRTVYAPAYYPDTPDFASAAPIRIVDGDEVPGLILTMRRVPVARVTGVALTSQGLPVPGTVRLMSRHAVTIGPDTRVARPGPDGEFAFADVPPGDYLVRTQVESGPSAREFAMNAVAVADGNAPPVMVRTSLGSKVNGTIVLEGGLPEAVLWGYSAGSTALDSVSSRGGAVSVGSVVPSGESFTLGGLAGPTRVRVWSDDQRWYLKTILLDGLDVTDTPFDFGSDAKTYSDVEVTFARAATITGRATDDRGAPVREYAVYVFATDRDKWFDGSRWVKLARASADGTFTASSLPPGEYWVAALDRVNVSAPGFSDGSLAPGSADWVDAELLTMLSSRATRITLGESQSHTATLRLVTR